MYKVGDFYDIDGIGVAVITCVDDPVIMVRRVKDIIKFVVGRWAHACTNRWRYISI